MIGRALDRLGAGGLFLSGATLLANLARYRPPEGELSDPAPRVSILVPARNEARTIERCVRSLLAQRYPAYELLVLDDDSEDATPEILARLAGEEPRLRVLRGAPLPDGWVGKPWACHQLAKAASPASDYLLFTDADTAHAPDALARTVAAASRDRIDLLSLMPVQETKGFVERAVISLLSLQILGYLPLAAAEYLSPASVAAANGQYMLFRRDAYAKIGGHATCKRDLAEDVALARAVKRCRGRLRLASGRGLVRCRMYEGGVEVIAGFRRSFRGGLAVDGPLTALVVLFNLVVYLVPFVRAPRSGTARAASGAILALRALLARADGSAPGATLLHVPGIILLLLAQALALWDAARGAGGRWKGREIAPTNRLRRGTMPEYTQRRRQDAGDP